MLKRQRSDLAKTFDCIATTHAGLEHVLGLELQQLGIQDPIALKRAVRFSATFQQLQMLNFSSRLALRFLVPVVETTVQSADEVYEAAKSFPWHEWFALDKLFAVESRSNQVKWLNNPMFLTVKVKDGIADSFRARYGKRPSVLRKNADVIVQVHLSGERLIISLDSTGASLHYRGYRGGDHEAPINEVLAAGMVALSGWNGENELIDPFCGTATILIEAASMINKIPPGHIGRAYCFQNWTDYDPVLFKRIREEMLSAQLQQKLQIRGSDIHPGAVHAAIRNVQRSGTGDSISIRKAPVSQLKPGQQSGFIITNPPYGERLEQEDLPALYKEIGAVLKQRFAGYEAWILTSERALMNAIGLNSSARIPLYNGAIECRFIRYKLYEGSKKQIAEEA